MNGLNMVGILFIIMVSYSCEDVIDVALDSSAESIIIEGVVTNEYKHGEVRVTKSMDYFKSGYLPKVINADVEITANEIITEHLIQVDSGRYQTIRMDGLPKATYHLKVVVDGKMYTSTSTMPAVVAIDSFTSEFKEKSMRSKAGYEISFYFTDPPGEANYYKIEAYRNGKLFPEDKTLRIRSDKYSDGKVETVNLNGFQADGERFEQGDTIRVRLYGIDKQVYDHFNTLRNITGSGFGGSSSTPANPITNITNGALGYFGAFAVNEKEVIVK